MTRARIKQMVNIYGLLDPRTEEICYIGASTEPGWRIREHIYSRNANTECARWVRELIEVGIKPDLTILETVPPDGAAKAENKWINTGISLGWPLKNTSKKSNYTAEKARTSPSEIVRIETATLDRLRRACEQRQPPVTLSAAVTFAVERLLAEWEQIPRHAPDCQRQRALGLGGAETERSEGK